MRNPTYEQALARQGVSWVYRDRVLLSDIDLARGLQNQARLMQPLDDDLVAQYAASMQDGVEFPAIVLHQPPKGKFVPIDGNSRLAATTRIGVTTIDAYVVQTADQMVVDRLTWAWNNLVNGKRLSQEECMRHALTMVRKYGLTAAAAAREWGLSPSALGHQIRNLETREIIERQGVKLSPSFTADKAHELSSLAAAGEDVLARAARVVSDSGLSTPQARELARAVKRARSHGEKMAAIEEFARSEAAVAQRSVTKGGQVVIRTALPRVKLSNLLRDIERLAEKHPDSASLQPLPDEIDAVRERARRVFDKLDALLGLTPARRKREVAG